MILNIEFSLGLKNNVPLLFLLKRKCRETLYEFTR